MCWTKFGHVLQSTPGCSMKYFFAIGLAFASVLQAAPAEQTNAPTPAEVEKRVERVINGLLPATVFRNPHKFGPPARLSDRMAHYQTPGVSIAVVNNHEI